MKLKPYPRMKDSGSEWLGDVPEHWEVRRLRNLVQMRASNVDKHIREGEQAVRLCNYVDVYKHERIRHGIEFKRATATADEVARFKLATGDVLITKDSEDWTDIGVPAVVEGAPDDVLCGYHLALLRPYPDHMQGRFLLRALQTSAVASQFRVRANGVTRYGLSHDAIKSVRVPVPPLAEQAAIACFLNHATRCTDRYIRAKERLIPLLEEQKRVIVHDAVTGRIDLRTGGPYPAYKPSKLDWLGDVPAHWQERRLGTIARVFNGATPSRTRGDYWANGTVPWLNSSKVNDEFVEEPSEHITRRAVDECSVSLVPAGAVVVGLVGQGRTRGMSALLNIATTISQNLAAVVARGGVQGPYLHRFLGASYRHLRDLGRGGNQGALNCDLVSRLRVLVPPVAEQAAIISCLREKLSTLDIVIRDARRQIELLGSYRDRLIADVVTGKLDLRTGGGVPADKLVREKAGRVA